MQHTTRACNGISAAGLPSRHPVLALLRRAPARDGQGRKPGETGVDRVALAYQPVPWTMALVLSRSATSRCDSTLRLNPLVHRRSPHSRHNGPAARHGASAACKRYTPNIGCGVACARLSALQVATRINQSHDRHPTVESAKNHDANVTATMRILSGSVVYWILWISYCRGPDRIFRPSPCDLGFAAGVSNLDS